MGSRVPAVVREYEASILREWTAEQLASLRRDLIDEKELGNQCREFLALFQEGLQSGETANIHGPAWEKARTMLGDLSRTRGMQGFTPSETAFFIFSLKAPVLERIRKEVTEADELFREVSMVSMLVDRLGLYTTEIYQKAREAVIVRQQSDMLELSTPVVKLWDGILALPMIGTLDSSRTQTVMETLLQRIVETEAEVAIIDITGVPTVDTLVAQHLMKTVQAARLMGAECIISGIRPQIAQTIVHLAIDLGNVITKATLADAFAVALKRSGFALTRGAGAGLGAAGARLAAPTQESERRLGH